MGMSSGWERFDFNKDAPLDDDDDKTEGNFFLNIINIVVLFVDLWTIYLFIFKMNQSSAMH